MTATNPSSPAAQAAPWAFIADLGAMKDWGLTLEKRHVVVDSAMRTNLHRVFAAGDITEYPGKVRLIAVGFGEAATAVNNAAVVIDPDAHGKLLEVATELGQSGAAQLDLLTATAKDAVIAGVYFGYVLAFVIAVITVTLTVLLRTPNFRVASAPVKSVSSEEAVQAL